jgi:hypothetical protein
MFQFPPCPPSGLWIQPAVPGYCPGGFPHSGIPGSTLDDSSPRHIAAIHALHRLLAPRHPPYALSSLIHARRQFLILTRLTCDLATWWIARSPHSIQLLRCQPRSPTLGTSAPHRHGAPALTAGPAMGRWPLPPRRRTRRSGPEAKAPSPSPDPDTKIARLTTGRSPPPATGLNSVCDCVQCCQVCQCTLAGHRLL